MILRDSVHGLVAFEGMHEQVVARLLATREVQRLRNIRQLGFTSLVFPGAEHSRFSHSLGATHVAVRMLARIRAVEPVLPRELRLDEEAEADVVGATVLHDLGHGPFSHLFEEVLPDARPHEQWTQEIVLDPSTDVHRVLRSMSHGMPERVAELVMGRHRLAHLGRLVSGTLDADRCDYLLRDSYMTGVRYGVFDLDWLLQALSFAQTPEAQWVLAIEGRKGLPPIEEFFLARQFMYQQVYHHKATRAAESLIRATLGRVAELVRLGAAPDAVPSALRNAAIGKPVTTGEYLELDDVAMLAAFRHWETSEDALLSQLAQDLSRRRLPKTLPLLPDGEAGGLWQEALERARGAAAGHVLRPELTVWLDVPSDVAYGEPDDGSAEGLWVVLRHYPIQRLGNCSFLLGELRNKVIKRPRLIFPAELRDKVRQAVAPLLGLDG